MSAVFESDASHGRNHAVFLARASSNGRAPSRYVAVQAGAPETPSQILLPPLPRLVAAGEINQFLPEGVAVAVAVAVGFRPPLFVKIKRPPVICRQILSGVCVFQAPRPGTISTAACYHAFTVVPVASRIFSAVLD